MRTETIRLECGAQAFDVEMATAGSGPPLLFLHAMDGVEGARDLIGLLAGNFSVVAPSHPGFGASSRPPQINTIDDLAFFYLDLLDRLDLSDITLVGASFGGWLANEILVRDATRISRIVLAAPLGLGVKENGRNSLTDLFSLPTEFWPALLCTDPKKCVSPHPDMDPENLLRIARNREAAVLYGWTPFMANPKLGQRLHRIDRPVLQVWGGADRIAPAAYRAAYAAAMPAAAQKVLPHCGHLVHADDPQALAAAILAFAGNPEPVT